MGFGRRAVSDFPVVLVLSMVLASAVLAVGVSGLQVARRLDDRALALKDFERFEEALRRVAGGVSSAEKFDMVSTGSIVIENRAASLWVGEQPVSSLILPLPSAQPGVLVKGSHEIRLAFENGRAWLVFA